MVKKTYKTRIVSMFLVSTLLFTAAFSAVGSNNVVSAKEAEIKTSETVILDDYEAYASKYRDASYEGNDIAFDATQNYKLLEGTAEVIQIDNVNCLKTSDDSIVEWNIAVPQSAFYKLKINYGTVEGKGQDIERGILIDGDKPYSGLSSVVFKRVFEDDGEPYTDDLGNQYHTTQKERYCLQTTGVYSLSDRRNEEYSIYLTAGNHTITFSAIQENMAVAKIILAASTKLKTYKQVSEEYKELGYKEATKPLKLQGEDVSLKSNSMLYAISDRTSPINEPYEITKKLLNSVGGGNWSSHRQWIEWDVDVKESGLYRVDFRAKQNFNTGLWSTRSLSIDGEIPFEEASNIKFDYSLNWQIVTMGNDDQPYLIYLEKGSHKIRLTVVEGDIEQSVIKAQKSLNDLTTLYRKIIMVTGTSPDTLRDYNLFGTIDNCKESFESILKSLKEIDKDLADMKVGEYSRSSITRLIDQIESFLKDPESIPERLSTFNSNITTFASWTASADSQPLLLDYVSLSAPKNELPKADCSFFKKLWNEIVNFFLSFISDYNSLSGSQDHTYDDEITLWLGLGIDQSVIMKSLIDSTFVSQEKVNVNLQLVNMGSLLNAVAAGNGPDVALFLVQNQPVDYALRNAVYDLSQFDDIDTVLERFHPSSYTCFELEGGLYALPEQQHWQMMFYRTDILEDMDIKMPQTWDDLYSALAVLQTNNLNISIDSPFSAAAGTAGTNAVFLMQLYQNGGQLYSKNAKKSALNSEVAIKAFTEWTELYTKYKLPQVTNALTRFRTGESPIVLTTYQFYNQLQISAPEISGLWDMTLIPGTVKEDGTIDRSNPCAGSGCVIFANSKNKEAAWKFLKWWTSADTQYSYGIEIESMQGASGRWPTANIEAMSRLPWSSHQLKILEEQRQFVVGTPEVAGGYYTSRYIDNAIRAVVNENENPRETILDYTEIITDEIAVRRKEFGLD